MPDKAAISARKCHASTSWPEHSSELVRVRALSSSSFWFVCNDRDKEALSERKTRAHEKTLAALQDKLWASEESNSQLAKRVELLEKQAVALGAEKVRLERACAIHKSEFECSQLKVGFWKNMCHYGEHIISEQQHFKKAKQRLYDLAFTNLATQQAAAEDSTTRGPSAPSYATMRLFLSIREQQLLDANEQLKRETQAYEVLDAKIVQLAKQVALVTSECKRRFKMSKENIETDHNGATRSSESLNDSGVSANRSQLSSVVSWRD